VPLIPNDETAARLGCPLRVQSTGSVSSLTPPDSQSTCGVGSSTCRVFGSMLFLSAMTILITPPTPAAACVCATFDLKEPSHSGLSSDRFRPYVASSACASIGSPSVVPVPCASTASTSAGSSLAFASAWRITRCCAGPLGAVRPLLAPSWLIADPRMTASTGCPLRRASLSRSSTSMPAPSPHAVPSAAAANDLQRPSVARPRCRLNSRNMPAFAMMVEPPASARLHSPLRSELQAMCIAVSEEEHAVSTETAGPSRPSVYAIRPEATLSELPVSR
jgi:hypothetical protein